MEKVIVAVERCYSDNDGAFDVVFYWDGVCVDQETFRGDYGVTPKANATDEQVSAAGDWMQASSGDVSVRNSVATYIGCQVTLQRSRKAPNKRPLMVVNHQDREWNNSFMRYDDEKICVDVDGAGVWVSVGCIKDVVSFRRPWWAKK